MIFQLTSGTLRRFPPFTQPCLLILGYSLRSADKIRCINNLQALSHCTRPTGCRPPYSIAEGQKLEANYVHRFSRPCFELEHLRSRPRALSIVHTNCRYGYRVSKSTPSQCFAWRVSRRSQVQRITHFTTLCCTKSFELHFSICSTKNSRQFDPIHNNICQRCGLCAEELLGI